jgi:hypothetical protein
MHNQQSLPTNITNWINIQNIDIDNLTNTQVFFKKKTNLSNNYEIMNQRIEWQPFMGSS